MGSKLFLDIGDVYTKFVLPEKDDKSHPAKSGFFVSSIVRHPPPHELLEFEEQIYFEEGQNSKGYLVGWPAILAGGQITGESPDELYLRLILNKLIFDNCEDNETIEVYITFDFGTKAELLTGIAKSLHNKKISLSAQYLYEDVKRQKQISVQTVAVANPLCLFEYFRSSLASDKLKEKCSMLIVDIGYLRSKIYIVDSEKGLEHSVISDAGTKIYYDRINAHFKETEHTVDQFVLMQELELTYPFISIGQEKFTVEAIIKNVRWDLNKDLTQAVSEMLRSYYEQNGHWVDGLVITGGGSVFNGDLLWVSLVEKSYSFEEVIIDKKSRYSVLDGIPLLLNSEHKRS